MGLPGSLYLIAKASKSLPQPNSLDLQGPAREVLMEMHAAQNHSQVHSQRAGSRSTCQSDVSKACTKRSHSSLDPMVRASLPNPRGPMGTLAWRCPQGSAIGTPLPSSMSRKKQE